MNKTTTLKERNERCLALWGCIPIDLQWVFQSKLYQEGNTYATGIVSGSEVTKKANLKQYFATKGINFQ